MAAAFALVLLGGGVSVRELNDDLGESLSSSMEASSWWRCFVNFLVMLKGGGNGRLSADTGTTLKQMSL